MEVGPDQIWKYTGIMSHLGERKIVSVSDGKAWTSFGSCISLSHFVEGKLEFVRKEKV